MSTAVPIPANDAHDDDVEKWAQTLASNLKLAPMEKRQAIAARLAELLIPKTVTQGGPVLRNVIDLFKHEQRKEWEASAVVTALSARGVAANKKQVYGALTYLKEAKILRKVGYGKYLIEGGGLLITHDKEAL